MKTIELNEQQLDFLKSRRFWMMVIGIIVMYIYRKGYIGEDEFWALETFFGGFITVRSFDRMGEQIGSNKEQS